MQHVDLRGSHKELLPGSRVVGPVDPDEIACLTVRVRSLGSLEYLTKKAYQLANTPLSKRKYLTHNQLEKRIGASQADLDKIEHFAQQHNLMVMDRSGLKRSIVLRGKLGDLRSAFGADIQIYDNPSGRYRGRQGKITIPGELDGIVTGVFGFDTRPKHRSLRRHARTGNVRTGTAKGVPPFEYAKRYNFPDECKCNGVALDGEGQTIAIIELGGSYRNSDLTAYFLEIGLSTPTVSSISVDHAGNNPTATASTDDSEVMLDIEVAGAVAPKAKIAVYFAPNGGDQGFLNAISAAVHDTQRKPSVISISWGDAEETIDQQALQAYHEYFAAAAVLGITVCVASGDDRQVYHTACDDLVLGCGGTLIERGKDIVWKESGGGISGIYQVPSYQTNVQAAVANGEPGRGVPDIAMCANNYFTRVDSWEGASEGTSAVAPLMAGLIARLNQAKEKNVGFLNPFLYANVEKGVVHYVIEGANMITNTWAPYTGLGTPDGIALLSAIE